MPSGNINQKRRQSLDNLPPLDDFLLSQNDIFNNKNDQGIILDTNISH